MSESTLPPEEGAPGGVVPEGQQNRRILISTSSLFTSGLAVAALGIISFTAMSRKLGPSHYGSFVAALALVSTAMLCSDLGINALTGREISREPERASDILSHNLGLRLSISMLLIPILTLIGFLAYSSSNSELFFCVVIASFAVPFDALRSVSLSYYVAGIRNHIGAAVAVGQQVLFVAGVIAIVVLGGGVELCVAAYTVTTAISACVAYIAVHREVPFRPRASSAVWRSVVAGSIGIGLIQLINLLYLKADTLILSVISTTRNVGIYGVAYAIISLYAVIAGATMTSLLPILTRAKDDELGGVVERGVWHLAVISTYLATLTLCFGAILIHAFAGPKYAGATVPLSILSVALIFTFLHIALGVSSVARSRHQRILYVSLIGLAVNVGANLVAIPRWGINGAAAATCLTEAMTLIGVAWVFRRDVGIRVPLIRFLLRPTVVGAALVLVFGVALSSASRGFVIAAGMAIVETAAYFVFLLLMGGLPPDYANTLRAMWRRLGPATWRTSTRE